MYVGNGSNGNTIYPFDASLTPFTAVGGFPALNNPMNPSYDEANNAICAMQNVVGIADCYDLNGNLVRTFNPGTGPGSVITVVP
jgi:hypothetical protein